MFEFNTLVPESMKPGIVLSMLTRDLWNTPWSKVFSISPWGSWSSLHVKPGITVVMFTAGDWSPDLNWWK